MKKNQAKSNHFGNSLEKVLEKFRRNTVAFFKGGAIAGAMMLASVATLPGCLQEDMPDKPANESSVNAGKADGIKVDGQRDTSMINYYGEYWSQYVDCGYRGGCQGIEVFVKLMVKPVQTADLSAKKVGISYRTVDGVTGTSTGKYFTTLDNGNEEWHIQISRRNYDSGLFTFVAFYEDGKGNKYYDDNNGEYHVVQYSSYMRVISRDYNYTDIQLTKQGVYGKVAILVADLDYDKDIRLVGTTDGWKTVKEFKIGSEATNAWYYVEDYGPGFEKWAIIVDIPGDYENFEYALVYRHADSGNRTYEFWDNNNYQNYSVKRFE